LSRFGDYRFVGTRDTMRVYDCDDDDQFEDLAERVDSGRLVENKLIQSFAPDTLDEARNRGFKPIS
jgi:hypothetical protein